MSVRTGQLSHTFVANVSKVFSIVAHWGHTCSKQNVSHFSGKSMAIPWKMHNASTEMYMHRLFRRNMQPFRRKCIVLL